MTCPRGGALVWRSLSLARRLGDRARFARSLAYVAAYACSGGRRVAPFAGHLIERAEALAQDAYTGAMVEAARSLFGFHRGDFEETLARTTELEERFMRLAGASRERVTARIYQGASLAMLGAFEPLAHHRVRLILDAEAPADRFALVNALSGVFNLESLARDAVPEARAELERARTLWGDTATTVQHFFFWLAEARVDLYEGLVEQAIERTERGCERLERALLLRMPFVRAHLDDLRGRAELMRPRPELRVVRRSVSALRRERASWIDALADALEHAEARHIGHASRAQLAAARARAGFERHGMRAHLYALELDVPAEGIRDLTRFRRALGVDPALAAAR